MDSNSTRHPKQARSSTEERETLNLKDGRSTLPAPATILRRVFRLGCVEVGLGYVRLVNKTNDTTVTLTPEQEQRWRARLTRQNP